MRITQTLLLLVLSVYLPSAFAQLVLVSDVDDTIKVSHVLDKDEALANGPMIKNAFIGMPELYRAIAKHPDILTVKYLSNAPKKLIGDIHVKFLKTNQFPRGDLVARRWRDLRTGNDHKLNSLRRFIRDYRPRELILIGDNGEADAEVYSIIRKEFPQVGGPTYIRQAYSVKGFDGRSGKPLRNGQEGFASSIDIALDLMNRGYLKSEAVEELVKDVVPAMLAEGNEEERGKPMAFPEWYDCRDFSLPELPLLVDVEAHELLQRYASKVKARCGRIPYDD